MIAGYAAVAVAVGLMVAFASGGRLAHVSTRRFRLLSALAAAVALQWVVELEGVPLPHTLLAISYVLLVVFCGFNLVHTGMGIVLVGITLNGFVIVVNGGMPVRESAVRAAGLVSGRSPLIVDEIKRHVEQPSDRFEVLADIIPVPIFREIVSFGDLVIAVGCADVVAHLLRPAPRHQRRSHLLSAVVDATPRTHEDSGEAPRRDRGSRPRRS